MNKSFIITLLLRISTFINKLDFYFLLRLAIIFIRHKDAKLGLCLP